MEYIRKFDNNYDYEQFLQSKVDKTDPYSLTWAEKIRRDYETKMFYLEEEEQMIIGSGRKDVPLDLNKTNAEMQDYEKAHISSVDNEAIEYNIYYKKLPKNTESNINLASVVGKTGYVVDEGNSQVKMILEDSNLYTTLVRDTDWKYNFASGNVTLLRPIEGDIILDFKGLLYTNLRENDFTLYISRNGGQRIELYKNGVTNPAAVDLVSGDEYEITADVLSGGPLSIAVKSGVSYCDTAGNVLYPKGKNSGGGNIIVTFSSSVHNGFKPISKNIQFSVSLEVAKVLNWDEIVPNSNLYAGNQLDLRGLIVSAGCTFFIQTSERIQTTEIDRVYNLVGNGSDATGQKITISITGNELYTSTVVEKTVNIYLNTNNMSWVSAKSANVDYTNFNQTTGKFVGMEEVQAGHPNGINFTIAANNNANNVNYSVSPALGNFIGNVYYPTLPDGQPRDVVVTAKILSNNNYRTNQITCKFKIIPIEIAVAEWTDSSNIFYGGNLFNLTYKRTIPDTDAVPTFTFHNRVDADLFQFSGTNLKLRDNKTLNGIEHDIVVDVNLNPGGNFKAITISRTIQCKLREIYFYFIESKVLYHNSDMSITMAFEDATLITNRDLSQTVWNDFNGQTGGLKSKIDIRWSATDIDENTMISNNTVNSTFSNLANYPGDYNIRYINNIVSMGGGIKFDIRPDLNTYPNAKYLYVKVQIPDFNNFKGFTKITKFLVQRPS